MRRTPEAFRVATKLSATVGISRSSSLQCCAAHSLLHASPAPISGARDGPSTARRSARAVPLAVAPVRAAGHAGPVRNLGPNSFASVMGTGIVATAAAGLPVLAGPLHPFALAVWVIAALLLVVLTAAVTVHWVRHPDAA